MKRTLKVLFAIALLLSAYSCTDETIGTSIIDTRMEIIEDSSFTITGKTIENHSLLSRTSIQLLGAIKSKGYGTLTSQVVTEFMPVLAVDTAGTKEDWIDSCKLILRLPSEGAFTGDSLAPMRVNVYKLNKSLPSPIYSDFDPTGYYDKSNLLGSAPYSLSASKLIAETDYSSMSTYYHREVEVPMPTSLAKELFKKFVDSPDTFRSPSNFAKYFPGVYIENSFGSGRVMNFTDSELRVFYRKHTMLSDTTDTISTHKQAYLASTPEVLSNNIINLDVDASIKERINNGEAIVMAPAGYEVQARFPIQDIINRYKASCTLSLSVINQLVMEIPVEEIETQYGINPPEYLLMVKTSMKDDFIQGDSLTNSKDSFYAIYNPTKKAYEFSAMRDYILDIIKNKNGVASEEDINFTIVPMDVTIFTDINSAFYYYYQSNPTSTVTKIAPQVTVPAVARLKLDKAKVKITFSKQALPSY